MTESYENWVLPFIDQLAASGATQFVISPGSRSTPLALAALGHPKIKCHVIVDERSAAFFALGQIRCTGRPSVLVCTSGSAGAHYYPAVIEAKLSCLPLIVLTADRPWEQQQCGANQTIDQQRLFGTHVKQFFEMGETAPHVATRNAVYRLAAQSVHTSITTPPGPVHINARFRKPLEPDEWPQPSPASNRLHIFTTPSIPRAPESAVSKVAALCDNFPNGIIICGPRTNFANFEAQHEMLARFSQITQFPIFADVSSNATNAATCIQNSSVIFALNLLSELQPDLIIEIGNPLVAGTYEQYIERNPSIPRVVLSEAAYVDAQGTADLILFGDVPASLQRLAEKTTPRATFSWLQKWRDIDDQITRIRLDFLDSQHFCDGTVVSTATSAMPEDSVLCLGNSMVIRDTDTFAGSVPSCHVVHQRGASGIDGLISGASGTASVSKFPTLLLVGDMSALHDLGGFSLLKNVNVPLLIVIINNNGGQIFNQLPIAKVFDIRDMLDTAFVIPSNQRFRGVCEMFDINYHCIQSKPELRKKIQEALCTTGATVIEALVDAPSDFRNAFFRKIQSLLNA